MSLDRLHSQRFIQLLYIKTNKILLLLFCCLFFLLIRGRKTSRSEAPHGDNEIKTTLSSVFFLSFSD